MSENDLRPSVWVGHIVLESDRLDETAKFMQTIGMRTIFPGPRVAVFELRGGTHLVVIAKEKVAADDAPFDLMVEDLHATHRQFASLGLEPTPIEALPACRTNSSVCVSRPGTPSLSTQITSRASQFECPKRPALASLRRDAGQDGACGHEAV